VVNERDYTWKELFCPYLFCREGGQYEEIVTVKAWNQRHHARAQEQHIVSL